MSARILSNAMQKTLIIVGIALVAVGLLWPWLGKIGFGRLPGDIAIEREGFRFYFPLATCLVISIVLAVLFKFFGK